MKRFASHPESRGEFPDVKSWPEIRSPEKRRGKALFFGSVTDPHLPQEQIYRPVGAWAGARRARSAPPFLFPRNWIVCFPTNDCGMGSRELFR